MNETGPSCQPFPPEPNHFTVVVYCYILPAVCVLGTVGNVANLITLASGRLKAVSYMYLRGLGLADFLCMVFVFVFALFEILNAGPYRRLAMSYHAAWYKAHLMLPLINCTVSAGILIVVALTLERYISISWPILFREWNSPRRAVAIIAMAYLFSVLLYVPMCWQSQVVPVCCHRQDQNRSLLPEPGSSRQQQSQMLRNDNGGGGGGDDDDDDDEQGEICRLYGRLYSRMDNNMLLKHSGYQAYKWSRESLLKFLPIVALTFLNLQIIIAFKRVRNRRRRLNTTNSNSNTREQRSLLILLAGIVVLFFICNIPAAINLVFISDAWKRTLAYDVFRGFANILEITNHALNFYNFCLCSSDYRLTFFRKFPCVKRVQESADNIRRRVSNSVLRVQGSKLESKSYVETSLATTSLRSTNDCRQQLPLRRALSSDALLKAEALAHRVGVGVGGIGVGGDLHRRPRLRKLLDDVRTCDVIPELDSGHMTNLSPTGTTASSGAEFGGGVASAVAAATAAASAAIVGDATSTACRPPPPPPTPVTLLSSSPPPMPMLLSTPDTDGGLLSNNNCRLRGAESPTYISGDYSMLATDVTSCNSVQSPCSADVGWPRETSQPLAVATDVYL